MESRNEKSKRQLFAESRYLSDDNPGMQMATLNQHIIRICGPPDKSGRAAETFGEFIGPEIEQGELSGNLSEENGLTLIGMSYESEENNMEVEVVPDLTTEVGSLPGEGYGEQPGTNNQPVCITD